MIAKLLSMVALILMALPSSAQVGSYQISRTVFAKDDDLRSQAIVWRWFKDGYTGPSCNGQFLLRKAQDGKVYPTKEWIPEGYEKDWYEPYYWAGVTIPQDIPVGKYKLLVKDVGQPAETDTQIEVIIRNATDVAHRTIFYPTNGKDDTQRVEDALAKGDVLFTPGTYHFYRRTPQGWHSQLRLVSDRSLYGGPGVVFKFIPPAHERDTNAVVPASRIYFDEITFEFPHRFVWNDSAGSDCVFHRCTFRNGQFGLWDADNNRFNLCTFDRAAIGPVDNRVMLTNCTFNGICPFIQGHEFLSRGGGKHPCRICSFNTTFLQTGRGFVLGSGWGPCSDGLFCGTTIQFANRLKNTELILIESGTAGVDRNMIFRLRAYANESVINFYDGVARDNLFWDGVVERSNFTISGDAIQTGNVIKAYELRGGGFYFGPKASNNEVWDSAILNWIPMRGNQFYPTSDIYQVFKTNPDGTKTQIKYPVQAEGASAATNKVQRLLIKGSVAENGAPSKGVTVTAAATQ